MATESEVKGIHAVGDEEMFLEIRPNGTVFTPWLFTETQEIMREIGPEVQELKGVADFCG